MPTSPSNRPGAQPLILILALDKPDFYNDMYAGFTDQLRHQANVEQITTPSDARLGFQRDPKPAAVLCVDGALTVSTRLTLVQEAAGYVRAGGNLIFMGLFSSFSRPPDIGTLFAHLGLPWTSGEYHRTTVHLNTAMTRFDTSGLARSYSQKALHLANVAMADAVYLPHADSVVESAVFAPTSVGDRTQTPAALASVGEGWVGYLGDVNNEEDTTLVALSICKFLT